MLGERLKNLTQADSPFRSLIPKVGSEPIGVQTRIGGALGRCRIRIAGNPVHTRSPPGPGRADFKNCIRKIRPARLTGSGQMVDPAFSLLQGLTCHDGQNSIRYVVCASRTAQLITDNPQLVPFGSQAEHGLDEILAIGGLNPSRAQDHSLRERGQNCDLSIPLRLTVHALRIGSVSLIIGRSLVSIEHVVGGNMDEGETVFGTGLCHDCRRFRIHGSRSQVIALGLINRGVGRCIHNDALTGRAGNGFRDRSRIGQINIPPRKRR